EPHRRGRATRDSGHRPALAQAVKPSAKRAEIQPSTRAELCVRLVPALELPDDRRPLAPRASHAPTRPSIPGAREPSILRRLRTLQPERRVDPIEAPKDAWPYEVTTPRQEMGTNWYARSGLVAGSAEGLHPGVEDVVAEMNQLAACLRAYLDCAGRLEV